MIACNNGFTYVLVIVIIYLYTYFILISYFICS